MPRVRLVTPHIESAPPTRNSDKHFCSRLNERLPRKASSRSTTAESTAWSQACAHSRFLCFTGLGFLRAGRVPEDLMGRIAACVYVCLPADSLESPGAAPPARVPTADRGPRRCIAGSMQATPGSPAFVVSFLPQRQPLRNGFRSLVAFRCLGHSSRGKQRMRRTAPATVRHHCASSSDDRCVQLQSQRCRANFHQALQSHGWWS